VVRLFQFECFRNLLITACFYIATGGVSIVFPKVTKVLGIFGGISSVNICYLVPSNRIPTYLS